MFTSRFCIVEVAVAVAVVAASCGPASPQEAPDADRAEAREGDALLADERDSLFPDGLGVGPGDNAESRDGDGHAPGDGMGDLGRRTTPGGLPMELPFAMERPDAGDPLSQAEITKFTSRITGFWKHVDYFTWVYETSHGVDASTGFPDYLIWWHDVDAVKQGDTVTFRNNSAYGGSHNNAEPTNMVLTAAMGGYLASGDPAIGLVVEQFARSNTACMEGFVFDEADPVHHLLARNIVTFNHEFTLPSGKKKAVDYSDWFFPYEGWNANRYNYPDNPTWGDVWVTTMRSKDDLPYVYQAAAWAPYVMELGADDSAKEASADMLEHVRLFAKDVVDSGYRIRSKDAAGNAYVPDADLASFVDYLDLFPDAECDARLATALLGYADPMGIDCGDGQGSPYDSIAGGFNYFNYQIIDHFHVAALQLSLTLGFTAMAEQLLSGLVVRVERYLDPESEEEGKSDESWGRDVSLVLLKGATFGMPLTSAEVRMVHKYLDAAVDLYTPFPNWDLWDPSVPDGTYDFREGFQPKRVPEATRIEEIAFLLEYCWSPFRNPAGRAIVDCDIVRNPSAWGE